MNMITKLVNTAVEASIVLNTEVSKAEQFRQATLEGATIGRTSFMNLVNGKVEEACGWKLATIEETPAVIAEGVEGEAALESVIEILAAKGLKTNIKHATTEVYATVVLEGLGRLQLNPTKKGFSLMFFPCKGAEVKDITVRGFTIKAEKAQYGRLETVTADQLVSMI